MANRHFPPLVEKTSDEDHRNSMVSVHVPKVIEVRDKIQSLQIPAALMSEDVVRKECECQQEIDRLQEHTGIRKLEEQRVVERFGVCQFMASDSDMRFYTGLLDYQTFISLYNFLKPKLSFSLNYYNEYSNVSKHPSFIVFRGRPRKLQYVTLMSCF